MGDGSALQIFEKMVGCHGGDLTAGLPVALYTSNYEAEQTGYIEEVNAELIGRASLLLGAGRAQTTDTIDHAAGISALVKVGHSVKAGDTLCTLHFNDHKKEQEARELLSNAFKITNEPVTPSELIYEIIQH